MQQSEFVDLAARMLTTAELEQLSSRPRPETEAVLDDLIEQAREINAQTFAQKQGLLATYLFDELGEKIMGLTRGARVHIRQATGEEVVAASVDIRGDAVVLSLKDATKGENGNG